VVGHTLMKWLFSFSRDDVVYLIRHFCELDKPFFYSLLNFNGEDVRAVILFFSAFGRCASMDLFMSVIFWDRFY